MTGIDGAELNGVLFKYDPSGWPSDLPFMMAEAFSARTSVLNDYLHYRKDLHDEHGRNVHRCTVATEMKHQPQVFTSDSRSW